MHKRTAAESLQVTTSIVYAYPTISASGSLSNPEASGKSDSGVQVPATDLPLQGCGLGAFEGCNDLRRLRQGKARLTQQPVEAFHVFHQCTRAWPLNFEELAARLLQG